MTTSNKLSLKQFIRLDNEKKQTQNATLNINIAANKNVHSQQNKNNKNNKTDKPQTIHKQSKKLKLNTLPCEDVQQIGAEKQPFLFRSTWEGDIDHFKQQMKNMPGGCTSPTFATQILSHTHTNSHLFPSNDQINQQNSNLDYSRRSNSRSKSKNLNKASSIKKFIGDFTSNSHNATKAINFNNNNQTHQKTIKNINQLQQQEQHIYQLNKLQYTNQQLKRQNKKLQQKYEEIKVYCSQMQNRAQEFKLNNVNSLMSNEQLLEKMKSQSFWKFYMRADKMIRASSSDQQQSPATVINFMKQLQALRQVSSLMKKQNKDLKKLLQQTKQQSQSNKQKISIYEAEVQQMRLKIAAYQSTSKKQTNQLNRYKKQLQKLHAITQLQTKLTDMQIKLSKATAQKETSNKKLQETYEQLKQQKQLNDLCEKQRVSIKKKYQALQLENQSLTKQLSSLKNNYNLLQLERQEMSANKKDLIEKEKLKQKIYHLEKELKNVMTIKEQESSKLKQEYDLKYSRQMQVMKSSQMRQNEQRFNKIITNMQQMSDQNKSYKQQNAKLHQQLQNQRLQNQKLYQQISRQTQQIESLSQQKQQSLSTLSEQLQQLNQRLSEQNESIEMQAELIKQLQKQINEKQQVIRIKQQVIKVKDYQSQKLRQSLIMIKEEDSSKGVESKNSALSLRNDAISSRNNQNTSRTGTENSNIVRQIGSQRNFNNQNQQNLEEYIARLQQKHNQALQLYQTIYNQKVQLQLQLQYYQQKNHQQSQQHIQTDQNHPSHNLNLIQRQTQMILQLIQSLLTIKQQIIKKILVFCPSEYKQLMIDYIYYGDMIKEKYLNLLMINGRNGNNFGQENQYEQQQESGNQYQQQYQTESQSQYCQDEPYNPGNNSKNRTLTNINRNARNPNHISRGNPNDRTKLYSKKANQNLALHQSAANSQDQQQISQLMQKFIEIGKLIQSQTKRSSSQFLSNNKIKKDKNMNANNTSKQKYSHQQYQLRRSKQKQNYITPSQQMPQKLKYNNRVRPQYINTNSKQKYININTHLQSNSRQKYSNKQLQHAKNTPSQNQYYYEPNNQPNIYKLKNKFQSKPNHNTKYKNNENYFIEQQQGNRQQFIRQPLKSIQQSIQYRNNRQTVLVNDKNGPQHLLPSSKKYGTSSNTSNLVNNNVKNRLFANRNYQQDNQIEEKETLRQADRANANNNQRNDCQQYGNKVLQGNSFSKKNNFNHGIINNQNLLKMIDRIKQ